MITPKLYRMFAVPIVLALAVAACGGPSTAEPAPTEPPVAKPTITPPAPTRTPVPTGGITSYQDVQKATIQIVAQGTFRDPEVGLQANAAGAGSGFLISKDGLAVTNNHVVTGAARLKVFLEGQEYRAKLLGASECWDLAVIQLEGDDFPYLELYEGNVAVGLEVYAAGFPLGDPEFTLTKGIVSKARADGESSWASVDSVIEHDATINPGNSGGPLVNEEGQLVGINYAGSSSTNQYYAIKAQDAQRVIDQLVDSTDVDSIGINGQAIIWNDNQNAGIWVASVKSGSPADNAGVLPGDILTTMEGLSLAQNGTLTEYCDIIRSHQPEDVLSLEVLRYDTQEFLSGQLNGRQLAVSYSFANALGGDVQSNSGDASGGYSGYVEVRDDSGAIKVEVPAEWADVNGSQLDFSGIKWAAVQAAVSADGFNNYSEPGVLFAVSKDIAQAGGYVQMLDGLRDAFRPDCDYSASDRTDYTDSAYEGQYDVFTNCKGTNNVFVVLSARPKENQTAFLLFVLVNIISDQDLNALDQIFATFDVVGDLP